ncbi:MAG: hypothetical protein ACRDXB_10000, partial [Actinomycetes bacterium]
LAGEAIVEDMARGPEAYLQMWERALGVSGDGCRDTAALKPAGVLLEMPRGTTARQVLFKAGQPHSRLGNTFSYCAKDASGATTKVQAFFDNGRLTSTSPTR